MKATIQHNLTDEELIKALSNLADQSEIGEELIKAIKRKTCACDDTPKEPRFPAMRELYRMFMQQDAAARADIARYAAELARQ